MIRACLDAADADIICLTEASAETLPHHGHVIGAAPGNSIADRKGAKKVLLWSRARWSGVSREESFVPAGRIVTGTTTSELGPLRIIGLCIPWHSSNTPRFGGDRRPWEDHLSFVRSLKPLLSDRSQATVVLGDFNQRLPRKWQPIQAAAALEDALTTMVLSTRSFTSADGRQTIDHIAHTPDLHASEICELPRQRNGIALSDHFGVTAVISAA